MVQVIRGGAKDDIQQERTFLAKKVMEKMRSRSEEEQASLLAQSSGLSYVDLNIIPINTDYVRLMLSKTALENETGIFLKRARVIYAVLTRPDNENAKRVVQEIAEQNGWTILWHIVSVSSLRRLHDRYKAFSLFESIDNMKLDLSADDFTALQKKFSDILALKKNILDMSTTQTLSLVVASAVSLRASDIHFEPQEEGVRMRYRLDGVLQDIGILPAEVYKYILSRIKMMGKMKLNIRKSAQDGHFSFEVNAKESGVEKHRIDIRASLLPSRFGETLVMRILDQKGVFLDIGELGLRGYAFEQLQEQIKKTSGMVVTTGPTGSGKTTLLYSILKQLNEPGVKIITIEDPVEYEVKNISQTNVSREDGYTFSTGLRSIVRQDPDIILVGEIRDDDTANIALQASLTGHFVLTTLHTNSAAGSIPRLINLGIKPSLIPSAINAFIAQRLVRRLCPDCRESYVPAEKTKEMITRIIALISPKSNVSIPTSLDILYRPKGCLKCNYTGYKGRIGIFEVLFVTESIVKRIEELAPEMDIATAAIEDGMITMTQDGILKAVEGITSMEEVWRVGGQFQFLEDVYEKLMMSYLNRALYLPNSLYKQVQDEVLTIQDFQSHVESHPVEEFFQRIVAYAVSLGAEDIHIEPEEKKIHIRFRIDGVLQSVAYLPMNHYPVFLGKIKLLSGIKTEELAGLRDSRFTIKRELENSLDTESIDVRVSIILGGYGETAVLRLLNVGAQAKDLASLGMGNTTREKLEEAMKTPNGVILTTGPTGSGKSTTLYSILSKLNEPHRKIMTVEDPIEYRINGVLQTQTDESKGYTFSQALRSLLRQNPDVILVGEIRDGETATMAVQSSLTGHLVFSTLHTNDAPSAIQRLLNMGVSPQDIVGAINFVMAQRLVRTLCECKRKREATEEEQRDMYAFYSQYAKIAQKTKMPDFSFLYDPVGCSKCRGIGYSGMAMICEGFDMKDEAFRDVIMAGGSIYEIRKIAIENGMVPMVVDGIEKVLSGLTSLEDVRRVTEL